MNRTLFEAKFRQTPSLALAEPVQPDEKLSAVIGPNPLPENELIKKLWAYIRLHGLQDQQKKMIINADAMLRPVFDGRSQVSIFELLELMSAHLTPLTR
jgi:chromatin remodeling complex protein RSC6